MKRIGILTWFHWNNYGTVLQAYALNRYLNQEGYLAETIKVIPDYSKADLTIVLWTKSIIRNLLLHRDKVQSESANKAEVRLESFIHSERRILFSRNQYLNMIIKVF